MSNYKKFAFVLVLLSAIAALASTTGSITGAVTDATGSVIQGGKVIATNTDTGITNSTITNANGSYAFPTLPVGHYSIRIQASGFSEFQETNIVLDVNTALRIDAKLQVSSVAQNVDVTANTIQVDTISTQLGDVIGSKSMTSLPLNGRSYTDLLALQPGVVPDRVAEQGIGDVRRPIGRGLRRTGRRHQGGVARNERPAGGRPGEARPRTH